jgi:hypothetical protein
MTFRSKGEAGGSTGAWVSIFANICDGPLAEWAKLINTRLFFWKGVLTNKLSNPGSVKYTLMANYLMSPDSLAPKEASKSANRKKYNASLPSFLNSSYAPLKHP